MKRKDNMPEFVYLGLVGINSKKVAYFYTILCIVIAALCLIIGFFNPWFFFGVAMLGAAHWYYYCIKWVDKNSSWD
jgi:uncharacterized membrane protein YphA (DoxX/SURF4 family)